MYLFSRPTTQVGAAATKKCTTELAQAIEVALGDPNIRH